MAKDGTNRGGRRVRAGSKPEALADKITNGRADNARIMEIPLTDLDGEEINGAADMQGEDMPKPNEYLSALQRDGKPLGADEIYREMWVWLKERGCEKLVNPRLIESFALSYARYVQCENAVSSFGLLGKHPTTGAAIANPFVQMAQSYHKQANLVYYEIFDIVKANCTTSYNGLSEDPMEKLLNQRKGK